MIRFPTDTDQRSRVRLAHALFYFGRIDEMAPVRAWLASELLRLDAANREEPDETTFRQRQGAAMAVSSLIKEMERAGELANELGKPVF